MDEERAIFTIADVLEAVPGATVVDGEPAGPRAGFGHLACHTKDVVAGRSIFAAVRGGGPWYVTGPEGFDYHRYVPMALESGAAGLLVEDTSAVPPGTAAPVLQVPDVIGALGLLTAHLLRRAGVGVTAVTGSTGKTSTCEIIACVLRQRYSTFKFISNRATPVSVPRNVLNAGVGSLERLVAEMPMDALRQIATLCTITPPQTGVVVNINDSHIVQLGSIEAIVDAKAELVEALPASGTAVLNFDDPRVRGFAGRTAARVIGVGTTDDCAVQAEDVAVGRDGLRFVLRVEGERGEVRFPVPSRRAALNALLGAGVGLAEGMDLAAVVAGLETFHALPGRMSPLHGRGGLAVLDNSMLAVPQSTELMLAEALEIPCAGRRVLAQGEIYGAFQHGEVREQVYALMERYDAVYLTGPTTHGHHEALLRRGAVEVHWHQTPAETVEALLAGAGPDDLVLVNGNEGSESVVAGLAGADESARLVDDDVRASM